MYPKRNFDLAIKVNFPPRVQAKDDVNVDYRGLESTFGVPRSSPGPPGKGSTKCHLGLRKSIAVAMLFRYTPQEESGAFGRRILLPPPLRGCPQGLPGEDPRTPSRRLRLRGLEPIVFQSSDNQAVKKALVPNPL